MYTGLQCVDNIVLITYHGFKNATCFLLFLVLVCKINILGILIAHMRVKNRSMQCVVELKIYMSVHICPNAK